MAWMANAPDYHSIHPTQYGRSLMNLVNIKPDQRILDIGCGVGMLTHALAAQGAHVLGIDNAQEAIDQAHLRYPDNLFQCVDVCEMAFDTCFDTAFSSGVFHLVPDQGALYRAVGRALVPGGHLICEFRPAGHQTISQVAITETLQAQGIDYVPPAHAPSAQQLSGLLGRSGMMVKHIKEYDRPMPLAGGEAGLRQWLLRTLGELSTPVEAVNLEKALEAVENTLRPTHWHNQMWVITDRRLRVVACKTF